MPERVIKVQKHKRDAVSALKERFSGYRDFIFTDYRGLTVAQITELRHRLRAERAVYKVIKNRFANIVFKDLKQPDVSAFLTGPTAIALAKEDSAGPTKVLFEFSRESAVKVKGGLIFGRVYDAREVEEISKLPPREALIAQLMRTMQAPAQNFVSATSGIVTKLVRTLQAVAESKKE